MKGSYFPRSPTATDVQELFVRKVVSAREVQIECPHAGDTKRSYASEPEKTSCVLCGVMFTKDGPKDHRDPEWIYTHPSVARRMIEAHVIVLVPDDNC